MQPSQLTRRVCSGNMWSHCSMRCTTWDLPPDVISFNAAITVGEKGGQWQRLAPWFNGKHKLVPVA
eukprot:4068120-Karenia_brevis.AAC.1